MADDKNMINQRTVIDYSIIDWLIVIDYLIIVMDSPTTFLNVIN